MKKRNRLIQLAVMAALVLASATVQASNLETADMRATGADADARGRASLRLRSTSEGRFQVRVKRLDPVAEYEILVGDVRVGAVTTNEEGAGKIRFRTRVRGDSSDEFLGFDPRGVIVAVRSAAGADVLAVALPAAVPPSIDDVICCIPDDSGSECEDRTPEECTAEGGTVATATSCLPNPCADAPAPPDEDVVCCLPDDSGPECEDRTTAECAAQGGVVVTAGSCVPNPCAAVPPSDPDTRCCLADDSGPECEDRTPAECAVEGGVDLGPGACLPNPCGEVTPPPGNVNVRVTCERRSSRSKVSVDGSGLAAGAYTARIVSGPSEAAAPAQQAIGDEAEFDFDSDGGDVGAGATPITSEFIQGTPPQVLGQIRDGEGNVVAEKLADCTQR